VIFVVKILTLNNKAMKPYIYLILIFFALTSCTKNDDPTIELTREEWYTVRMNNGGSVRLIIEGTTNADKVTVTTYGDGLISDHEIDIKLNHFKADVGISFIVTSMPLTGEFVSSTELKIYKETKMITLALTSDTLKY
jgi:hypothetical protein